MYSIRIQPFLNAKASISQIDPNHAYFPMPLPQMLEGKEKNMLTKFTFIRYHFRPNACLKASNLALNYARELRLISKCI